MIKVDISKCTGCRMCETACSFFHTGRISPQLSRINVLHLYETGIDGPIVCIQCKEKYCNDCPDNAISIGKMGEILISPTICTLCEKCVNNCPIGAIKCFEDIIFVCDLCGGTPRCVEACSEKALIFEKGKSREISLEFFKLRSKKLNLSEKNKVYLESLAIEVRKKWRTTNV